MHHISKTELQCIPVQLNNKYISECSLISGLYNYILNPVHKLSPYVCYKSITFNISTTINQILNLYAVKKPNKTLNLAFSFHYDLLVGVIYR